jgi:hypothetical protein
MAAPPSTGSRPREACRPLRAESGQACRSGFRAMQDNEKPNSSFGTRFRSTYELQEYAFSDSSNPLVVSGLPAHAYTHSDGARTAARKRGTRKLEAADRVLGDRQPDGNERPRQSISSQSGLCSTRTLAHAQRRLLAMVQSIRRPVRENPYSPNASIRGRRTGGRRSWKTRETRYPNPNELPMIAAPGQIDF